MENKLQYLEDTYLFESETEISSVGTDERGRYVTLKNTIFHPQGGGQPSDTGVITGDNLTLNVSMALFVDGDVRHYFNGEIGEISNGNKIKIKIDENSRIQNAKCHTSGHIVQAVVESLPYNLRALKGYHFSNGSYVEFSGKSPENTDQFITEVNSIISSLIQKSSIIETKLVTYDEIKSITDDLPYEINREKPLRITMIDGFKNIVPCGGTHLKNSNELEMLKITKVKSKKGNVKISYEFK